MSIDKKREMDEKIRTKVIDMARYIIENKSSTRKTGEHFGVSNFTVSDYINKKLPYIDPMLYKEAILVLEENKPKSIRNENVVLRVRNAVELLKQGLTVNEIAKELKTTPEVIYNDFHNRLEKLDKEECETVKKILAKNRYNNLNNNSNVIEETSIRPILKGQSLEIIANVALHFRLSLNSISILTGISPEQLYNELYYKSISKEPKNKFKNSAITDISIKYLITESESEENLMKTYKYLLKLFSLKGLKQQEQYNKLFEVDKKFYDLLRQSKDSYTKNDYVLASLYRLKYALTAEDMSLRMGKTKARLLAVESTYSDDYSELKEKLKDLNEFIGIVCSKKERNQKR